MSSPNSFYIPTINVEPFLVTPESAAAAEVVDEVRRACISTGFFQIIGHGFDEKVQRGIFKASREFFQLPLEEKKKLDCKNNVGFRGYDVLASQSYEVGVEPDLKEGYYIGADIALSNPLHGRFFSGPNVWPDSLVSETQFRSPCEEYYKAIHDLGLKILGLVGATFITDLGNNNNGDNLSQFEFGKIPLVIQDISTSSQFPACPLRLLRYPAATRKLSAAGNPQYGSSAHTDFGVITLLLQDENPGLEVLDIEKDIWMPIDPTPNAFVVNIGDMMSLVTGGKYKSSVHRVVCKRPEKDRYSVVFFWDGCLDAELRPVDNSDVLDDKQLDKTRKWKTVEQHMIERLTMSYGVGNKDPRREGLGSST